jgi:hypothetical protein
MNSERTSTNSKLKLRRLLKKKIYKIKMTAQNMTEVFNKDGKPQKKESNRNPKNKNFLKSN